MFILFIRITERIMDEIAPRLNQEQEKNWQVFGDLCIHTLFLQKGLLVITPNSYANKPPCIADNLCINEREFVLYTPNQNKPPPNNRSLRKASTLLSTLLDFNTQHQQILQSITDFDVVLFNKKRREELFLPVLFSPEWHNGGLYVCPWLGKSNQPFSFSGFKQFVTAGCMFGASLQGVTNNNKTVELINHQLTLDDGDVITQLKWQSPSPFESILFNEFKKTCLLVNALTSPNDPKQVLYHLPAADYIIFGIKLFLQGKITRQVLQELVDLIRQQEDYHRQELTAIAKKNNIDLQFTSPFANALPHLDKDTFNKVLDSFSSIQALSLPLIEKEQLATSLLLNQLQTNTFDLKQAMLWQKLCRENPAINDIEGVFKLANTLVLAQASQHHQDYEVCSLLPLSEKQIQVHFDLMNSALQKKSIPSAFPALVFLTLFDPVVTYSESTNGHLFYFASGLKTLNDLIVDTKICQLADSNLHFFANHHGQTRPKAIMEATNEYQNISY